MSTQPNSLSFALTEDEEFLFRCAVRASEEGDLQQRNQLLCVLFNCTNNNKQGVHPRSPSSLEQQQRSAQQHGSTTPSPPHSSSSAITDSSPSPVLVHCSNNTAKQQQENSTNCSLSLLRRRKYYSTMKNDTTTATSGEQEQASLLPSRLQKECQEILQQHGFQTPHEAMVRLLQADFSQNSSYSESTTANSLSSPSSTNTTTTDRRSMSLSSLLPQPQSGFSVPSLQQRHFLGLSVALATTLLSHLIHSEDRATMEDDAEESAKVKHSTANVEADGRSVTAKEKRLGGASATSSSTPTQKHDTPPAPTSPKSANAGTALFISIPVVEEDGSPEKKKTDSSPVVPRLAIFSGILLDGAATPAKEPKKGIDEDTISTSLPNLLLHPPRRPTENSPLPADTQKHASTKPEVSHPAEEVNQEGTNAVRSSSSRVETPKASSPNPQRNNNGTPEVMSLTNNASHSVFDLLEKVGEDILSSPRIDDRMIPAGDRNDDQDTNHINELDFGSLLEERSITPKSVHSGCSSTTSTVTVSRKATQTFERGRGWCVNDRYTFVEVLGRGAQGSVWKAYDRVQARHVAIKIVPRTKLAQERRLATLHGPLFGGDPAEAPATSAEGLCMGNSKLNNEEPQSNLYVGFRMPCRDDDSTPTTACAEGSFCFSAMDLCGNVKLLQLAYTVGPRAETSVSLLAEMVVGLLRHECLLGIDEIVDDPNSTHVLLVSRLLHGPPTRLLCDGTTEGGPLPPVTVLRWASNIASALHQLHSCGIVHCDVKLDNMLRDDERGTLILADFGLATLNGQVQIFGGGCGTYAFWAPELFKQCTAKVRNPTHTSASDCYALGVCLFTLLFGRFPYWTDRVRSLRAWSEVVPGIHGGKVRLPPISTTTGTPASVRLLQQLRHTADAQRRLQFVVESLLHPDPAGRMSAAAVMQWTIIEQGCQ